MTTQETQWTLGKHMKIKEPIWQFRKTIKIEENNENWGKQYDSWGNTMKNEEEH